MVARYGSLAVSDGCCCRAAGKIFRPRRLGMPVIWPQTCIVAGMSDVHLCAGVRGVGGGWYTRLVGFWLLFVWRFEFVLASAAGMQTMVHVKLI